MYLFLFLFEGRPEISRGNYIILKSEVDLEATVQVCQVGAHFKALGKGVLVAPSDLRCIFVTSQTRPQERCVAYNARGPHRIFTEDVLSGWSLFG